MADLVRRFRPPAPPEIGPERPASEAAIGDREVFWATDMDAHKVFTLSAMLSQISPRGRFYLQEGESATASGWEASTQAFEGRVYPALGRYLAAEEDGTPITVLSARVPGVRGYFSDVDTYPRSAVPWSNGREMVYLNSQALQPGTAGYDSTLAHESAHLMHHRLRGSDDAWVSEGVAELFMRLAGYATSGGDRAFRSRPDTQLTTWSASSSDSFAHYGASYLFLSYFLPRFGGYDALPDLLRTPGRDTARFDAYLEQRGYPAGFDGAFADWAVANLVNDQGLEDGRYGYRDLDFRLADPDPSGLPLRQAGNASQYSAVYISAASGSQPVTVFFTGTVAVPLLDNQPHSGSYQWWSHRGDSVDTKLTREFDLTGVSDNASLDFWAWYDLEKDFDYAAVAVSTDSGETWSTLPGASTTDANPMGNNLGHAYTGRSGGGDTPQWVRERIDLTPYVGRRILLRFEQVTDDAYNAPGFAWDDLAIPAIGFLDDAEADTGWQAEGFLRIRNEVPQGYAVRVVQRGPGGQPARVQEVPLDEARAGQLLVPPDSGQGGRLTVVVVPMAPITTVLARYELAVVPSP